MSLFPAMRRDKEEKESGGNTAVCSKDEQLILGGYQLNNGNILHRDLRLK